VHGAQEISQVGKQEILVKIIVMVGSIWVSWVEYGPIGLYSKIFLEWNLFY
jgi:hypothetical protein